MFRVKVAWEQTVYYEVTVETNAPPDTHEWWDEVWLQRMGSNADAIDADDMKNITFTDVEIV